MQEIGSRSNWTTPLVFYLKKGALSGGKEAARKLKIQVARFVLIKDVLYKRGFSRPYLRCLSPEEADYVIRKWRDLREPIKVAVVGTQTNLSWILLAHYAEGCSDLCQCLRQMSKVQQHYQTADERTDPNDGPVAIRLMGIGHHGPIPNSHVAAEVPYSRHRLFHQMGRIWSLNGHHKNENEKLCIEEHCL